MFLAVAAFFRIFNANGGWLVLLGAAGSAAGAYLFYNGFRLLRFKRMILDTPLSRIHSASIGLVEVTGTPVGPYILAAPITGDPCFYYRVRAWQWVESDSGKSHEWKSVLDESLFVPFFLEDGTGRVLIDPKGAEMDVHKSFSDEIGASIFLTRDLVPPHIRDFLAKRGLVPAEKIKLEERIIPKGFPLFVFGTLGENTVGNAWSPRPQTHTSSLGPLELQLSGSRIGVTMHMASSNAGRSNPVTPALVDALNGAPGVHAEASQDRFPRDGVFTMAPDRLAAMRTETSATTSPAKPSAGKSSTGDFDLHPSVAIGKGERHEPFAISGHSQKEVAGKLAWQSAACIWGGPLLTLASLYFLMNYFRSVL
jgi:hypothetical protein